MKNSNLCQEERFNTQLSLKDKKRWRKLFMKRNIGKPPRETSIKPASCDLNSMGESFEENSSTSTVDYFDFSFA